jgi:hypothetical protein
LTSFTQAHANPIQKRSLATSTDRHAVYFILGLGLLLIGMLVSLTPPNDTNKRFFAYFAAYGLCAPFAGVLYVRASRLCFYDRYSGLLSIFCTFLALGFILTSAADYVALLWSTNATRLWAGGALGLILCCGIVLEARQVALLWPIVVARILAVGVVIVSIVATALVQQAVNGNLDWIMTLGVSIAPAIRFLSGGVPLVDEFSQYGLAHFLIFAAAFSTIVAPSFPSAVFVVSLANAAYVGVAATIMLRCVRSFMLAAAATVLIAVAIVPAWLGLPSAGGLRFLPPLLVVLGFAFQPLKSHMSFRSLVPLLICAFWSIEVFIWGFLTFSCGIGGRLLFERARLAEFVRCIGGAALMVIAAHAFFSIAIYFFAARWPRYDISVDMIRGMVIGYELSAIAFSTPAWAWAVEGMIYFVALGVSFAKIVQGWSTDRSDCLTIQVVLPASVAGLLGMSYWIGRPLEFNLWPTVIPAVIIATIAVDRFLGQFRCPRPLTLPDWVSTLIIGGVITFLSGVVSVLAEHRTGFSELISGRVKLNAYVHSKIQYLQSLKHTPMDPQAYDPISWDTVELIRKYQPAKKEVALFIELPRDVPVYLLTGQKDAFGTSSFADNASQILISELAARVPDVVVPGTYVFIQDSFADYFRRRRVPKSDEHYGYSVIQFWVYPKIRDRYNLCIVEESQNGVLATVAKLRTDESCSKLYDP